MGFNSIEEIPVDVQPEKIQEIDKIISFNPWYDFYTELSRLPPDAVQMNILFSLQSKFADWIDQQGSGKSGEFQTLPTDLREEMAIKRENV